MRHLPFKTWNDRTDAERWHFEDDLVKTAEDAQITVAWPMTAILTRMAAAGSTAGAAP
jgi:hypothetical protein